MKLSMYKAMITLVVMALFQKHGSCSSNKAMTVCGEPAENLRSSTELCSRGGVFTEFKMRLPPPTICRRTSNRSNNNISFLGYCINIHSNILRL